MSSRSLPAKSVKPRSSQRGIGSLLRFWFGFSAPVGRLAYAASGLGLLLVKYAVEALAIWSFAGSVFSPLDFLNPLFSMRAELLQPAPEWLAWALVAWSMPFLWIAISMSVRRTADCGATPWLGLLVMVPLLNLIFMLVLCCIPGKQGTRWGLGNPVAGHDSAAMQAVMAVAASLMVGAVMLVTSVYLFFSYGSMLFVATPVMMSATAAYLYNRRQPRSYTASLAIGLSSICFAAIALLLFALEGLICIAMALPLLLPLGALGGLVGKAIADATSRPTHELVCAVAILPLFAAAESRLGREVEYEVMTAIPIEAPPETVWRNVVNFPDLRQDYPWYFRWGIACPVGARIEGAGVGATRYCEFTTGTFVEPITVWSEPYRLAFDVADQPAPMFEMSPYRHVHPPHLDGYMTSRRGEFRLLRCADGSTRLEGRTWYSLRLFPEAYWSLWCDALIGRIHLRVLRHVKQLSEADPNHVPGY